MGISFCYTTCGRNTSYIFNCHLYDASELMQVAMVSSSGYWLTIYFSDIISRHNALDLCQTFAVETILNTGDSVIATQNFPAQFMLY